MKLSRDVKKNQKYLKRKIEISLIKVYKLYSQGAFIYYVITFSQILDPTLLSAIKHHHLVTIPPNIVSTSRKL